MKCENCGKEISDKATFCGHCGSKVNKEMQPLATSNAKEEVDAVDVNKENNQDNSKASEPNKSLKDSMDEIAKSKEETADEVNNEGVDEILVEKVEDKAPEEAIPAENKDTEQVPVDEIKETAEENTNDNEQVETSIEEATDLEADDVVIDAVPLDEEGNVLNKQTGNENAEEPLVEDKVKPKKKKKKKTIIIVSIIVILLLIGGGVAFYVEKNIFYKMNVTISSNVDDADIYLDDEKIGTLKNGILELNNIRWHKDMTLYAKKHISGDINDVSEKRVLQLGEFKTEHGYIELKLKEPLTKEDITKFLSSMYYELISSEGQVYDAVKLMSYFEGKDKNHEFKDFASLIDTFINNPDLKMISITPTVESLKRIDSDKYEASYIVAYRFSFEDKYDKKEGSYTYETTDTYEKEQVFRYKKAIFIVSDSDSEDTSSDDDNSDYMNSYDRRIKIKDLGGQKGFEKVSDKKHKVSSYTY